MSYWRVRIRGRRFGAGSCLRTSRSPWRSERCRRRWRCTLRARRGLGPGTTGTVTTGSGFLTGTGSVELAVPRDREGRFEPQLIEKWARRLPGFDEKVISLYARGMTTREIRAHVEELYGVTVSRELISKVTDEIHEELREWRSRPLEAVYSDRVFRRVAGEDPRGGGGSEQGGSSGDRDYGAGAEGDFGDVDGGAGGGERGGRSSGWG